MTRTYRNAAMALTLALCLALVLPVAAFADSTLTSTERSNIVAFAKAQAGKPYSQSIAINPATKNRVRAGYAKYDCSGLTWRAYKDKAAMEIGGNPLNLTVQYKCATAVDQYRAAPRKFTQSTGVLKGDLIFVFKDGKAVHVGVCDGSGYVTHASSAFGKVVTEKLSTFRSRYVSQGKSLGYGGWYNTAR